MNFYRSSSGGGHNYIAQKNNYSAYSGDKYAQHSAAGYFANNSVINQNVYTGNEIINCDRMLQRCYNFNSHVFLGKKVKLCDYLMASCSNFNSEIHFGNMVESVKSMLESCLNFNKPIELPNSIKNLDSCFYFCNSYNQPTTIPKNAESCHAMFRFCRSFCQDITIPKNVTRCAYMFDLCTNMGNVNIYINGTPNVYRMLNDASNGERVNIFCNKIRELEGFYDILGYNRDNPTWTAMENGYYNAQYNVYLYTNYIGT